MRTPNARGFGNSSRMSPTCFCSSCAVKKVVPVILPRQSRRPSGQSAECTGPAGDGAHGQRTQIGAAAIRGADTRRVPGREEGQSGHVSARAREAGDDTRCDGIAANNHDNRHGRGGLFGREGPRGPVCREEVDLETNQFGRKFCQSWVISFRPAEVDENVVALNVAEVAQPSSKSFHSALYPRLRVCAEKSNACGFCLPLRACCERPRRRRAAERSQQFPPSDGDCHTPLPCEVRKWNDITPRACCP